MYLLHIYSAADSALSNGDAVMNNHTKFASWKPNRLNLDLRKGIYMNTLSP